VVDIIWENTTSQKAKDFLPGIAAMLHKLQQPYLVDRAGEAIGLFVLSDNALVSASNSAFFNAINKYGRKNNSDPSSQVTPPEPPQHAAPIDTSELETDQFVKQMEDKFGGYMRNWKSEWKPQLLKWLTYEAQQGKSQLDTRFAYINKHLTKACLSGGIDYLDPRRVLQAFRYKGGARRVPPPCLPNCSLQQTIA
jgi:hypothetical protein